MAELTNTWPTLFNISKDLDSSGKLAAVGEVLTETNEILDDIPWVAGNSTGGHKISLRENIPAPTWRQFNQGVYPSVSTTGQIMEVCGTMSNYSEVDKALADLNGNTADYKLKQAKPIMEGFNQSMASTLISGDYDADNAKFNGLAARYYGLTSSTGGTTYKNVIGAGGSTKANGITSIYLVGWSPNTVYGIYPKGSTAGLHMNDLGEVTLFPTAGGQMQGYRTYFQWDCGMAVEDWRYVVRIANIDVTALLTAGDSTDTSANVMKYMSMALDIPPTTGNVRWAFYCHPKVRSMLRVQLMSKSNAWLSLETFTNGQGIPRPTLSFMGVPIRRVDEMTLTESVIS
ncbi:MAG: hypothetical protein H6Q73_196 [Firmicutes bacterium]|nr:hypothetical protein [Bacillota bacterium]